MSRKESKLERPDKCEREYRKAQRKSPHKDFYEELIAEYRVGKKFQEAGIIVFPEINATKSAKILDCSTGTIMGALHTRRLRGRRVGIEALIRIVDVWYFGVSLEKKRMKKNKNRFA